MSRCILITGCSSGIGAALAREFHRRGHVVYATARRPATLAALADEGLKTLALDVNDDASIAAAMVAVQREQGRLDVLINNAGYLQVGAVVDLTREDLRRQYETNVIAPVQLARAALPLLRAAAAQGSTAVLANVGSIVGVVATPFAGAYCSSKAGIHSLTDAVRMELAPFGIHAVSIQPGGIKSAISEHAEEVLRLPDDSIYKPVEEAIHGRAQLSQRDARPAEEFAVSVADRLLRERPPAIIRAGTGSTLLPSLKTFLPIGIRDALLSRKFGLGELNTKR